MENIRALRRIHTKRIQEKRFKNTRWMSRDIKETHPNLYGRFKWNHLGCGCTTCKPWKWGLESKLTQSEQRSCWDIKDEMLLDDN